MKNYLLIIFWLIGVSLTYAQQDTLYLKNKFNEEGNVVTKDTTFTWAPLFYVDALNNQPVTGVIVEKFRKNNRVTHAKDGYTLKQKSVQKKYTFYVFYDPNTQNFTTVHYWNKRNKFEVLCMSDDKYPYGVDFESLKNGEIRKTVSKEEETVTTEYMMNTLIETLPQYETDFLEIFSKDLDK